MSSNASLPDSNRPKRVGSYRSGDKCMPAKKGFDIINKFEKILKMKKSITRR
jgi:hypothetical protein